MQQRTASSPGPRAGLEYNLHNCTAARPWRELRAALTEAVTGGHVHPALAAGAGVQAGAPGVTRYVLRCVYQRPRAAPLCPTLVSAPIADFAIAPFFDLDAPARPVRIALPIDTSIAGLRRFKQERRLHALQAAAQADDPGRPA